MKLIKCLLATLLVYWVTGLPIHASAASEFSTSFTSLYTIAKSGETQVTHTIILKNNLAHIYATDYTLATSGENLVDLATSDETGSIQNTATSQNGTTNIHLKIAHPSIGKDQEKKLTISYTAHDVVEQIGDTLTINIPRLAKANEAETYTRIVKVEGVQDLPQFISPPANSSEGEGEYGVFTFNGHQNDSLTLLFGESVTYKLNLTYELKNKELKSQDSELAIPPDTGYQRILIASIDPQPSTITLDKSGNWLARYTLKPQEKLLVKAVLYATVYPRPTLYDPSTTEFQKTPHSKYWDTGATNNQALAQQLKSPQNIYKYLADNFVYNYAGVTGPSNRLGATVALTLEKAVLCTEFTDSFIALARINHIASREINGYGYTKNNALQPQGLSSDILHAWPEYYDSAGKHWVAIDPTWGNTTGGVDYFTKLDFSHITFVRHGDEDSYPLPAGAYKSSPTDKYISVEVAAEIPESDSTIDRVGNTLYNRGNVGVNHDPAGYIPPYGTAELQDNSSTKTSLYDKIKALCVSLLSKFWQPRPAST